MFENLNLRSRILVGYAVPLLVAIGMIATVYLNVKEAEDRVKQIQVSQRVLTEFKDLDRAIAEIQRSARGYIIVKNENSLKDHADAVKSFDTHSGVLLDRVTDLKQRENLQKIFDLGHALNKVIEEEIALVNEGKKDRAVELFGQEGSFRQRDRIMALVEDFEKREMEIIREKQARQIEAIDRLYTTILAGTFLFFIFAGGSSLWIARFVGGRVSDTANALLSATTEISSTVSQHERTAAQQASSVEEATATVEELSASSRQSAEQASASAVNTEKATKQTADGAVAVKQAMAGMERLGEKVGTIADQVLRLGEQASQIGSIASLVRDLAGQTNMLALNAAVEAARAGEQGKGFAVVASEVRKLADQSKKSAEQAALLVANVQKAIDSTIMMTEEGTKAVEDGTQLTRQIGALFDSLSAGSENVYRSSKQVMLNGQQQSAALTQMVETINSINLGAKETVAGLSQTKIAIQKVDDAARNLKALV